MNVQADNFPESVSSWSELATLIEHFSYYNGHDWLFRGVTDSSHELRPKIGRKSTRKLKPVEGTRDRTPVPYREPDERAALAMFRQQARAYLLSVPQSDLEWLAIAQHFGLPTRLLDWTDSLLVAAWFAVEKGGAKKVDSALWVTRSITSVNLDDARDPLSLDRPVVYRPPHTDRRIAAQGSVLMVCPAPTNTVSLSFSRKISIARKSEFTIKKRLNACGINRRHLFPDLSGLADHIGWMYKNDWLMGYRPGSSTLESLQDDTEDEEVEK